LQNIELSTTPGRRFTARNRRRASPVSPPGSRNRAIGQHPNRRIAGTDAAASSYHPAVITVNHLADAAVDFLRLLLYSDGMSVARRWLVTIWGWTAGIIVNTFLCLAGFPLWLLDPVQGRLLNLVHRSWGYSIARLGCTRIDVEGRENIPSEGPVVFFANHSSAFDIYILSGVTPGHCAFFAKKEVFYVPLVGQLMWLQGCVPVYRKNPRKSLESVEKAVKNLRRGVRLIVFPEGTRSATGDVLPFKSGSLRIPSRGSAAVVPVSIAGSRHIMRKGSMLLYRGPVRVAFGRPHRPPSRQADSAAKSAFLETIRQEIIETRNRLAEALPAGEA
jgi:1-acyl-sn-glycerol-3-phosphate acyltransferase